MRIAGPYLAGIVWRSSTWPFCCLAFYRGFCRQLQGKLDYAATASVEADVAAVRPRNFPRHAQTQARSLDVAAMCRIAAVKSFEYPALCAGRDSC